MINHEVWDREWNLWCDHWRVEKGPEIQARYFEFLNEVFDDRRFVMASQAVFVSREFFPRLADFLTVDADHDFEAAMALLWEGFGAAMDGDQYRELTSSLSTFARHTLGKMGGLTGMGGSKKDRLDLQRLWRECYTTVVQEYSRSLPHVEERARLTHGQNQIEDVSGTADGGGVRLDLGIGSPLALPPGWEG